MHELNQGLFAIMGYDVKGAQKKGYYLVLGEGFQVPRC
jgi:hypothetical protein